MSRGDQGSLSLLWDKPILFNLQKRSFHFCDGVRTIHSPLVTSAPAPGAHKDGSALTLVVPACPLQKSNQLAGFKLDVNTPHTGPWEIKEHSVPPLHVKMVCKLFHRLFF